MFRVAEGLTKPVLSAGKILRDGANVHLERGNSFMNPPGLPMERVPLELRNNSVYLRSRVPHWAAGSPAPPSGPEGPAQQLWCIDEEAREDAAELPVKDEEASGSGGVAAAADQVPAERRAVDEAPAFGPMMHPGSRVDALKARLKEIGGPIWGTKAQLWARLQERELRHVNAKAIQQGLHERARGRAEGEVAYSPITLPAPVAPSPEDPGAS